MPYRGQPPVLLGIIGDSGSGRSTLSRGIEEILGSDRVNHVCLDDYHRYDRKTRARLGITALHPDCNHVDLMGQHLSLLRQGETIYKPVYDHSSGLFVPGEIVTPRQLVVVNGLLGLHSPELRACYHVSVYLDPDPDLRVKWKIQTDTARRGYTPEQVRDQLERRRGDAETFVHPQAAHADLVIQIHPPPGWWARQDPTLLNVRILMRRSTPDAAFRELLPEASRQAEAAGADSPFITLHERSGEEGAVVEIQGNIPEALASEIENRLWRRMERVRHLRPARLGLLGETPGVERSRSLALAQSLVTHRFVQAAEAVRQGMAGVT